jgi:hypothetical protein
MDLIKMREQILSSNDITVIASKQVIAEIILLLNISENWTTSMVGYDAFDDNILMLTKLCIKRPTLNVETALFKDGTLNCNEGNKLLIEKSSMETIDRLGLSKELLSKFKDACAFW